MSYRIIIEDQKGSSKMTRLEENAEVIHVVRKINDDKPSGTFGDIMSLHFGSAVLLLADISKSLAIIADKAESEMNILEKSFNESRKKEL